MLFELTNFQELIKFSFEWNDYTITKYIKRSEDFYTEIEIHHQTDDRLDQNIILPFKSRLWNHPTTTKIIWNNNRPFMLCQNPGNYGILKFRKTSWNFRFYSFYNFIKKIWKLHNIQPQIELSDIFRLAIGPNRLGKYCAALADYDQPTCFSAIVRDTNSFYIHTYNFDKEWHHIDHIKGSSLYFEGNHLKTIKGNYQLPFSPDPVPLGQWLGDYYVIGADTIKVFVPWKLEYVKYMSFYKMHIIQIILLCIRRRNLYKWIGPGVWKEIIIPRVVFHKN